MWASPNVSAYLHVDSTDYIVQYMLHYVPFQDPFFHWGFWNINQCLVPLFRVSSQIRL